MKATNILILPGWQDSDEAHWQSIWERKYGYQRVRQHDWARPLRGDWIMRLEEVVQSCDEPVVLVAHSLGCILVSAWAERSQNTSQVTAALLVAPGDVESEALQPVLKSWSPIVTATLPFPSILVGSRNDPYCTLERAQYMAQQWGSQWLDYGEHGHINGESGLGEWLDGHARLQQLMNK